MRSLLIGTQKKYHPSLLMSESKSVKFFGFSRRFRTPTFFAFKTSGGLRYTPNSSWLLLSGICVCVIRSKISDKNC
eukprot:UN19642